MTSSDTLERRLDIVVTQGGVANPTGSFLLVVSGEAAGKLFPLNKPDLVIGRSPSADIRINEKAVSHTHARVKADGERFTIRDLGSTNGTLVNGAVITATVALSGGDTVSVGATTFTFLAGEDAAMDQTMQLQNGTQPPPPGLARGNYLDSVRQQPSMPPAPMMAASQVSVATVEDEGMSFTDVLRKVHTYWIYTKRYGWLVATCTCFGIAAGIVQTRMSPPAGLAWSEVNLLPPSGGAPVEYGQPNNDTFFLSPASTFSSLPLIKKTMKQLGVANLDDENATRLQEALSFDQLGYQSRTWRAEFKDATAERAAEFLRAHLDIYLNNEIDRGLRKKRSEVEFTREKVTESNKELKATEAELLSFRTKHPEAIPREGGVPKTAEQLSRNRAQSVRSQLTEAEQKLSVLQSRLNRGIGLKQENYKKASEYLDKARAILGEIATMKSQGLGEEHPDVRAKRRQRQEYLKLAEEEQKRGPSQKEVELNAERIQLQDQIAEQKRKVSLLQGLMARANQKLEEAKGDDLPALLARYSQLERDYERLKKKLVAEKAELEEKENQLRLDREFGRDRLEILTPPTPEEPSVLKTTVKRSGVGGFVGLFLAVLAAGILEIRRRILARSTNW